MTNNPIKTSLMTIIMIMTMIITIIKRQFTSKRTHKKLSGVGCRQSLHLSPSEALRLHWNRVRLHCLFSLPYSQKYWNFPRKDKLLQTKWWLTHHDLKNCWSSPSLGWETPSCLARCRRGPLYAFERRNLEKKISSSIWLICWCAAGCPGALACPQGRSLCTACITGIVLFWIKVVKESLLFEMKFIL